MNESAFRRGLCTPAAVMTAVTVVIVSGCEAYDPARVDSPPSASVAATSHVECGSTITTSVALDADLVCTTAPGLIIDADDVTLDGNGHKIFGPGITPPGPGRVEGRGVWVKSGRRRATLRNLTVTGFDIAIHVLEVIPGYGSCNVLVGSVPSEYVIVANRFTANGGGVALACSHGNQILNNIISDNDGGISISGTRNGGNLIAGNRVERNGFGLFLLFAPGNTVTGNTFSSHGIGIFMGGFEPAAPSGIVVEGNVVENGNKGIVVQGGEGNRISRNRVAGNIEGIELGGPNHVVVENVVISNREVGIGVGCCHTMVTGNTISNTGAGWSGGRTPRGINVGRLNEIAGNTVSNNTHLGLVVGDSNLIHDNRVAGNGFFGFMLRGSGNVVFHNDVIANNPTGIGQGAFAGQVYDDNTALNYWHEPTLLEGNHWSDYTGLDDGSGTDKHAVAGDGIGDTRIPHPAAGFDFYPFVNPAGWRVLAVAIDIKPRSFPNTINLGSGGTVPVAIFSTASFDATTVDPATVALADAGVKLRGKGTLMVAFEDVNADGLLDLVLHVETAALQLTDADTQAVLEGRTFAGTRIRGSDTVRIVP